MSRVLADSWGGEVSMCSCWGWEGEIERRKKKSNAVIQVEISYVSCHCSVFYKKQRIQLSFLWFSYNSWRTQEDVCAFLGTVNACLDVLWWRVPHLKKLKRGCFLLLVSHLFLGILLVDHHILETGVALPWVQVGAKERLEVHCYNHCSWELNIVFPHKTFYPFHRLTFI